MMVGVTNIPVSTKEFNDYKRHIKKNKNISLSSYFATLIRFDLAQVKKQKGKCQIRSEIKQLGEIKGSCRWNNKYYKVVIWQWNKQKRNILWSKSMGYFDDLYHAEQALNELFAVETEKKLYRKFEEKRMYHQRKYKLKTKPAFDETTYTIKSIHKSKSSSKKKKALIIEFKEKFINPENNKHQKTITFGRQFLDEYTWDAIIEECVNIDDPKNILKYKTNLEFKINPNKYIYRQSKRTWYINKKLNGNMIRIGPYYDYDYVIKDRDYLVKNKWNEKIIEYMINDRKKAKEHIKHSKIT